jgi:hypothetical protein
MLWGTLNSVMAFILSFNLFGSRDSVNLDNISIQLRRVIFVLGMMDIDTGQNLSQFECALARI